ncbi:MAG: MOSC domain-containing protein [Alkalilacustris sp.]
MTSAARLAHIVRHPIKAVGVEELATTTLTPGQPLPGDRAWAVAHAAAQLGEGWVPKMNFLRGVSGPELMAIRAETAPDGRLTLTHPRAGRLEFDPSTEGDRLLGWIAPLWPEGRPAPQRLVRAPDTGFCDIPDPWVSILSLVSLRVLSQRMGRDLSIHRFRGNLWLDGLAPWEEFDLIGREICIGGTLLRVRERITRCKATTANPDTGRYDADTLGALEDGWGHTDFGIYAEVLEGGPIRTGDAVEIPA